MLHVFLLLQVMHSDFLHVFLLLQVMHSDFCCMFFVVASFAFCLGCVKEFVVSEIGSK